jgi:hypothetical protein
MFVARCGCQLVARREEARCEAVPDQPGLTEPPDRREAEADDQITVPDDVGDHRDRRRVQVAPDRVPRRVARDRHRPFPDRHDVHQYLLPLRTS